MPKVSIVLPTYNGEKYINESINSIMGQDFSEWELIIVDDCSTDSTYEIINEYSKQDSRIKIIHNNVNKKLPKSLNIGFEHAKGEYFTWTSDDNIYLPDAISTMVNVLDNNKDIQMVCADMEAINFLGEVTEICDTYNDDLIFAENNVGACFLYRKTVMDEIGKYDTKMFLTEDYDYWLRIKVRYGYIHRIDKILYQYRKHESSLTETKSELVIKQLNKLRKKYINQIFSELKDCKKYLAKIYYDFIVDSESEKNIINKFYNIVPELLNEIEFLNSGSEKKVILFGAGEIGQQAYKKVKDKVVFFADNSNKKVGKNLEGKRIISFEEVKAFHEQYDIIIAVGNRHAFEVLEQFYKNNIYNVAVWALYKNCFL